MREEGAMVEPVKPEDAKPGPWLLDPEKCTAASLYLWRDLPSGEAEVRRVKWRDVENAAAYREALERIEKVAVGHARVLAATALRGA